MECQSTILVITSTNYKLFKSWKKLILSDGKIFVNSFVTCNYWKTLNFFLATRCTSNWMGVQTNKICTTGQLIIQSGRLKNHCILNVLQRGASFHSAASLDLFSKDKTGCTVSVNYVQYEEMSKTFFLSKRRWVVLKWTWFQQYWATPHTTGSIIHGLKQKCYKFWWPSWSPDLTPYNFFL